MAAGAGTRQSTVLTSLHDSFLRARSADDFPSPGDAPRRSVKRGRPLFHAGECFEAVFTVRYGFFKTLMVDSAGREQVSGFFMAGDSLGLDGLAASRHDVAAIALEESEVWVMPFAVLEKAAHRSASLQRDLNVELAREIVRHRDTMMLLGSMVAEERLAAFLIDVSSRFAARGCSACDLQLRMTREEIGSYLGLKLETVSRLLSSFRREGLIEVDKKRVRILNPAGIGRLLGPGR